MADDLFPRLYWNPQGQEVRVESPDHMQELGVGEGWTDAPPLAPSQQTVTQPTVDLPSDVLPLEPVKEDDGA